MPCWMDQFTGTSFRAAELVLRSLRMNPRAYATLGQDLLILHSSLTNRPVGYVTRKG